MANQWKFKPMKENILVNISYNQLVEKDGVYLSEKQQLHISRTPISEMTCNRIYNTILCNIICYRADDIPISWNLLYSRIWTAAVHRQEQKEHNYTL